MTQPPKPTATATPASPIAPSLAQRRWPVALLALTLAACGGGGGDSSSGTTAPAPGPGPAPSTVAPSITTQPSDLGVVAPAAASFTIAASGSPTPTIQWQKSAGTGSTFADIQGATSATLALSATTVADSASQYRAVVTNSVGVTTSRAAVLTVTAATVAPVITSQPGSLTVTAPATATFTVAATATPTPTYQWQSSSDGTNFTNIAGATGTTYNTAATTTANSGQQYRVVVSNGTTSVPSAAAVLTVVAGAAGSASACTGASSYAAGFRYDVVYQSPSASGTFTTTTNGVVNGTATFHGQTATEVEENTAITSSTSGLVISSDTKTYLDFNAGTSVLTQYGSNQVLTDLSNQPTTVDVQFAPPSTDARFTLNVGASTTVQTHQTVTRNGQAQPSTDESSTVVFGGVETLTVPAGTYQACKYTVTTSNNITTTSWLLLGSGVLLKSTNGASVSEATSVRINGATVR